MRSRELVRAVCHDFSLEGLKRHADFRHVRLDVTQSGNQMQSIAKSCTEHYSLQRRKGFHRGQQ